MIKVFVLTGSYQQFLSWCLENRVSKNDKKICHLTRKDQLYGIKNPLVLRWGTFNRRDDYFELWDFVEYYLKSQEADNDTR